MGTKLTRRGLLGAAALACTGATGLTGCDDVAEGLGQASSQSQAEADFAGATLRCAYMPNLNSASTLFCALDQGYFEELGLTIETRQFEDGPSEIAAMGEGEVDVAEIGHGAHAHVLAGEAEVFSFEQLSLADEVVASRMRGVDSPEALAGKRVARASGTSSEVILHYVLQAAGLSEADVTLVEMAADDMPDALISGDVDAVATWSPYTVTLREQLGDDYLCLGNNAKFASLVAFPSSWCCSPSFAEANTQTLVRFAAALDQAKAYRNEHIDEVARMLATQFDLPDETLLAATGEGDWQGSVDAIGQLAIVESYYEAQQKALIDAGKLSEHVDVEGYLLADVIEAADALYLADA